MTKKKEEELTKKRILAEHLKKMKLEVEDRERIRCINDQIKRILRLMETEAENIAPPPSPLSSSPCPAPAPLPPSAPAPPPAPQSWVWVKRKDQVHLPTPPIRVLLNAQLQLPRAAISQLAPGRDCVVLRIRNHPKGHLELFRKFIRFGRGRLPLSTRTIIFIRMCRIYSKLFV